MPPPAYRTLEIEIGQAANGVFPVVARVPAEDRRAESTFTPPYSAAEIDRALGWMEQGLFDEEYVKQFGAKLFDALFVGPVKALYEAMQTKGETGSHAPGGTPSEDAAPGGVRYRLLCASPETARVPWELLYDAAHDIFLARAAPLVRAVSLLEPTAPLEAAPPLRVLVVDSFPEGVPRVEGQAETEGIRAALAPLAKRGRAEVATLPHVTLEKLQNALREAADPEKPRPFHVLHFIGHGRYDEGSGRTLLLFEDAQGQADEVDAEALLDVIRPFALKMVFLNACQSAQSSALDLARGFAPALLGSGIPAVVGMQVTVLDEVAVRFSRRFYEGIADNQPVDAALAGARQLERGTRVRRKSDMGIPICYLRTASGQILELQQTAEVPLSRDMAALVAAAGIAPPHTADGDGAPDVRRHLARRLLGGGAVFQGAAPPDDGRGPRGRGAVHDGRACRLGRGQGKVTSSQQTLDFAQSVYARMGAELETMSLAGQVFCVTYEHDEKKPASAATSANCFDVHVRGPAAVGTVPGATAAERAKQAAEIAPRINAQILIYGTLETSGGATSFAPEFYVDPDLLARAEELSGRYSFGREIRANGIFPTDAFTTRDLRQAVLQRTRILAYFVMGMGAYLTNRFDEAASYFGAVEQMPGWDDRDGKELLYLMIGNVAGKRTQLDVAESYYKRALNLNPTYARAHIGLGEVLFQRASGTCEPGRADGGTLEQARAAYEAAATFDNAPGANIPAKAALGIGRVDLCYVLAGDEGRFAEAESNLQSVVKEYEGGNDRIRELAALAHAALAVAYLPPAGSSQDAYRGQSTSTARRSRRRPATGCRQRRMAGWRTSIRGPGGSNRRTRPT